jgi:hypothetical protein
MNNFITLEGGYLAIATFILLVTIFVTTRPFMSKNAFKIGFPLVLGFLVFAIGLHFYITTNRMNKVKEAFENGQTVICESRAIRKVAQTILINKNNDWKINEYQFISDKYERGFHLARCIVK